jgi:hypothetical protein
VFHALIFAAITLIILGGPENLGAEKAVPLGLKSPVIDGFRFFDLTVTPSPDPIRTGQRDSDLVKADGIFGFLKEAVNVFHVFLLPLNRLRALKISLFCPLAG